MNKVFTPGDRVRVQYNFREQLATVREGAGPGMVSVLIDGELYGRAFPVESLTRAVGERP